VKHRHGVPLFGVDWVEAAFVSPQGPFTLHLNFSVVEEGYK